MSEEKQVIKSHGNTQPFDSRKIYKAITQAMKCGSGILNKRLANLIVEETVDKFSKKKEISTEEIDKFILNKLNEYGQNLTANSYERYKTIKAYQKQKDIIDEEISGIVNQTNKAVLDENSNKDGRLISTQRDLIAGTHSRSYCERVLFPTHILHAHQEGLIHIHDTDYLIHDGCFNCMLINVKDMLDKGTVINGHMIESPKSLMTAATIASQISLQISNGQHGGQTITLSHLAPYVRVSREKIYKNEKKHHPNASEEEILKAVEDNLHQEIASAMQTLQYQENTFSSANGQTPFVSLFLYISEDKEYEEETAMLIEEVLKQRLLGMKNEDGVYVTPAFPKLLFVLDENNVPEDSKYHYLFKLAVKCSAKRMNPDYISAKIMRQQFENEVFPCMGCRSFLSPWKDENGKYKWYGRFNRGVVTINLVDVALSSKGDEELFWNILDARLELAKEALIIKDKKLVDASPTVSPSHWMYGGIARLKKDDVITPLLRGGYSSISLGYIGVYEMCMIMTKQSHTQPKGNEFAKRVLKYLEQKTIEWREIPNLNGCSLYGTPSESLCYKFALKTQKRFGVIPGITDKDWFTNSYHVCVYEPIDAFKKFKLESEFQKMSKGGAVSYVEVPDMTDNLPALEEIVRYMYDTIQYAEINTRNGDYCDSCGFEGEIKQDDNGEWYCPQCGEKRRAHLHLVRRVCGYVSTTMPNHGKAMEMKNRVYHIGEE